MPVVSAEPADCRLLHLQGEATLTRIDELHQVLLDAARSHKELSLDLAGVIEIDVPVMQLLCSAARSGCVLRAVGEIPAAVSAQFHRVGLETILTTLTRGEHGKNGPHGG